MSIYDYWSESDCITSETIIERIIEQRVAKRIWVDRQGNEISFDEMSDEYIENCINYMRKKDIEELMLDYKIAFENELLKRAKQ